MAATIHDVAKRAGVNSSTVSRVLNGKASISEETKEKIHAAMRELDYHPNSVARSLASGLSGAIGLVVDAGDADSFSNVFFSKSLFAIEKVAQAQGYHVIIANNRKSGSRPSAVETLIWEKKVDGLILPPSTAKTALLAKIGSFPCVVLGRPDAIRYGTSWVDVNNEQGSEQAVEHLLTKGYQHLAFLGGDEKTGFVKRRMKGYLRALPKHCSPLLLPTDGSAESACLAVKNALYDVAPAPDAFVCNDNVTAFGALRAVKKAGLRVPEEIGLVAFDNFPLAEYTDPPLTAVDVDTALLGEQTALLLFGQIERRAVQQQILLGTTLLERESTCRM